MKLTCDTQTFSQAVSNVMKAVSNKSTLPILEGICLTAEKNTLTITGYDLELGITTQMEAQVTEPGAVVLTASYLYNIVRKMPAESLALYTDEKEKTTIESGVASFQILGMAAADYPEMPHFSGESNFSIKQPLLKNMIDMTLFAVASGDTSRPVQTGSYFDIENGKFVLVSVDGFRLALRQEILENNDLSCHFVVPGKTLSEISKLIDGGENEEQMVNIRFSGKHAIFEIEEYTIVTRLLEGEFLDYKNSIPKGSTTKVDIGVRPFVDSIERTSLLITERLKSPLRCLLEENRISISCVTAVGRSYDEVDCSLEGERVDIGFNSRYLLDALRASMRDKVILEINGPLSPMKILPGGDDSFLYLVLPMRLKNEID